MIFLLYVIIRLDRTVQVFSKEHRLNVFISGQIRKARIFLDSPIESGNGKVYFRNYIVNQAKVL